MKDASGPRLFTPPTSVQTKELVAIRAAMGALMHVVSGARDAGKELTAFNPSFKNFG